MDDDSSEVGAEPALSRGLSWTHRYTVALCCAEESAPEIRILAETLVGLGFNTRMLAHASPETALQHRNLALLGPTIYVVCHEDVLDSDAVLTFQQELARHRQPLEHLLVGRFEADAPLGLVGAIVRFAETLDQLDEIEPPGPPASVTFASDDDDDIPTDVRPVPGLVFRGESHPVPFLDLAPAVDADDDLSEFEFDAPGEDDPAIDREDFDTQPTQAILLDPSAAIPVALPPVESAVHPAGDPREHSTRHFEGPASDSPAAEFRSRTLFYYEAPGEAPSSSRAADVASNVPVDEAPPAHPPRAPASDVTVVAPAPASGLGQPEPATHAMHGHAEVLQAAVDADETAPGFPHEPVAEAERSAEGPSAHATAYVDRLETEREHRPGITTRYRTVSDAPRADATLPSGIREDSGQRATPRTAVQPIAPSRRVGGSWLLALGSASAIAGLALFLYFSRDNDVNRDVGRDATVAVAAAAEDPNAVENQASLRAERVTQRDTPTPSLSARESDTVQSAGLSGPTAAAASPSPSPTELRVAALPEDQVPVEKSDEPERGPLPAPSNTAGSAAAGSDADEAPASTAADPSADSPGANASDEKFVRWDGAPLPEAFVQAVKIRDIVPTERLFVTRPDPNARSVSWAQALRSCNEERRGGVSGWRLPHRRELKLLAAIGVVREGAYWSRTQDPSARDLVYVLDAQNKSLRIVPQEERAARAVCVYPRPKSSP